MQLLKLLGEAFRETEEEMFERAENERATYRRLPGQSVASYIGQMKRLRAQYQQVDTDLHLSDKAWAHRLNEYVDWPGPNAWVCVLLVRRYV